MKFILIIGCLASVANMILHYDNDPAFYGWLSSAMWSGALYVVELLDAK
jgi:hypothetical protein